MRRLLVVLQHPHHFDLQAARASGDLTERYLIEQLQELVSVAFTAATSPFEAVRPAGIVALFDIADKFGPAEDPDYEGKRLIELYAAQISAALRPCFAVEAEPSLAAAGCATTSRYLLEVGSSARNHQVEFSPPTAPLQPLHLHLVQAASLICPCIQVDHIAVRKLLGLLLKLASPAELGALVYPAYSESSATMVRAAALQATAQLMQAAVAPAAQYPELLLQLAPTLPALRDCWLALLRDFSLLSTQQKSARRSYRPHLYAPSTARAAYTQLLAAWPPVLAAVAAMVPTTAWAASRESAARAYDEAAVFLPPSSPWP